MEKNKSRTFTTNSFFFFSISGCSQISPNALCGLNRLPNITELELTNCPSATPSVVHYLRDNMYDCLVVQWCPWSFVSIVQRWRPDTPHSVSRTEKVSSRFQKVCVPKEKVSRYYSTGNIAYSRNCSMIQHVYLRTLAPMLQRWLTEYRGENSASINITGMEYCVRQKLSQCCNNRGSKCTGG